MRFLIFSFCFCIICCGEERRSDAVKKDRLLVQQTSYDSLLLISGREDQRIGFYLPNKLDKELYPYILDSRERKSRTKKILIDHPSFLLGSSLWLIPYYVYPGEKLNVVVDDNGIGHLSAGNSIRNNELNFFVELHKEVNSRLTRQRTLENMLVYSKILLDKQLNFCSNYFIKNTVSQEFKIKVENYLQDEYLANIFSFSNNRANQKLKFPDSLSLQQVFEKLNLRQSTDESFAFYKLFFNILNYFFTSENSFQAVLDSCKKYFNGSVLDYAQFRAFDMFMDKNPPRYEQLLNEFLQNCHDSSYIQVLSENYKPYKKYNELHKDNFFEEVVESADELTLKWKDVLATYKGKVILLDFWARWCVPCIEELPYLEKIKPDLTGKDVVVVMVSIDVNKVTWKKGLKENDLESKPDSYLIVNSSKSLILKNYKIEHVPRYIILKKNGDLAVLDAPRPSSGELQSLLIKYTKD